MAFCQAFLENIFVPQLVGSENAKNMRVFEKYFCPLIGRHRKGMKRATFLENNLSPQ